jgi:antitoxin component YwqK of YwqJK toxin-antitoxin module
MAKPYLRNLINTTWFNSEWNKRHIHTELKYKISKGEPQQEYKITSEVDSSGMLHGTMLVHSKQTGRLIKKRQYVLDKRHGTSTHWYDSSSYRYKEGQWCNGIKHGQFIYSNPDGFYSSDVYSNGLLDGLCQYVSADGMTCMTEYHKGKLHGKYIRWWKHGGRMEETTYVKGKQLGVHRDWYFNGQLKSEYIYGQPSSASKVYREDGSLVDEDDDDHLGLLLF